MTDRPILFSGPMIRALLDGTKTQTRRLVKPNKRGCPYGKPGDRLWVRETCMLTTNRPPLYRADVRADLSWQPVWKPSIHIPRWASRLTLIVTDVRAQRLQDISEDDARAEGIRMEWIITGSNCNGGRHSEEGYWRYFSPHVGHDEDGHDSETGAFAELWNSINGPGAWDENPWVWTVSFDVERRNIDAVTA